MNTDNNLPNGRKDMLMKLNRKIAALLLCLMLLPMLFSCSESKNTDQPKTDAGTSQSSAAQGGE